MMVEISDITLMLYEDGDLNDEDTRQVEEYLKQHPEILEDMEWWKKESAVLQEMAVGKLSHEGFKKKVEEYIDAKTSTEVVISTIDTKSNVLSAPANDNAWMRIAASLVIAGFVGYGFMSPLENPEQKYLDIFNEIDRPSGTGSPFMATKSVNYTDGDILRGYEGEAEKDTIPPGSQAVNFRVRVTTQSVIDGLKTPVSDGDTLRVGDKLRIHIDQIKEDGILSVEFKGSDGKIQDLLTSRSVKREGIAIRLPEESPSYFLEPGRGMETLTIKFRKTGSKKESSNKKISYFKDNMSDDVTDGIYGPKFVSQNSKAGEALNSKRISKKFVNLFSLKGSKEFLSVFQLSANSKPLKTRGPKASGIYNNVKSSVVKVMTNEGIGAGIVVSADGLIATNYHVVKGYRRLGINFVPGNSSTIDASKTFFARVVVVDEIADLALLKLEKSFSNLAVAKLAAKATTENNTIKVGSDVYAIGHPSGLDWTFTTGTISQIRKKFVWPLSKKKKYMRVADVIQTETAINPGNSGGPLLNQKGEVIGINSFVKAKRTGLNFAVNVTELHRLILERKDRKFPRPLNVRKLREDPSVKSFDVNKNGKPELYIVKLKNTKSSALIMVDKNEDGKIDYFLFDKNADGKPEAKIYARFIGKQRIYIWRIDSDGDGKADAVGKDLDGDWRPDNIRPIKRMTGKTKALKQYTAE